MKTRNTILATALAMFIAAPAMAWNSGSNVAGHNSASASAGTSSAAQSSGNGFAANEGTASQTSNSTLNLHASPTSVGATGTAHTSGLTTNHSVTQGHAVAGGKSVATGSASYYARGTTAGAHRAYDGTRAVHMGGVKMAGGTTGKSKTASGSVYNGASGGAAYNSGYATGDVNANFDFNRRTGADSKDATSTHTSGSLAETTKYRSGWAGVTTNAGAPAGSSGMARMDAQLRLRR